MRKKDLKDGMRITFRDGDTGVVSNNEEKIISDRDGAYFLCYYNDDLTRNDSSPDADIVSVSSILWSGNEIKEMTIKDIEDKLGYKIKIIE